MRRLRGTEPSRRAPCFFRSRLLPMHSSARFAAHSTPILIDGRPGVAAVMHGAVVSIMAFDLDGERIVGLRVLADPARLERLGVAAAIESFAE